MPLGTKDIEAGLVRKGFERRESKDIYLHLHVGGKKTPIYTKMSHGERQVHDGLVAAMARQVRLTRSQFIDLVRCPLSRDDYLALLREHHFIE